MKIELREIPIRALVEGYVDNDEEGVVGYGGRLNIRPKYQREFIYKEKERNAVIETVKNKFPLNVMYWVDNGDDNYEVLDGQQRIVSICQYWKGDFSLDYRYFHNLTDEEKDAILDYPLMVYFCSGSDKEKLDWFKTINIAGVKLSNQELRNAVYCGSWVTDAKRHFSRRGCPAHEIGKKYLQGAANRQEFLETAIKWYSDGNVEEYMSRHQHDGDANELWLYFKRVIDWVEVVFSHYRKEMKGVDWGTLYNVHGEERFDAARLRKRIDALMMDEDVTRKAGIYPYVLSGEERHLNVRAFSDAQKRAAFEKQGGVCPSCEKEFGEHEMEADHITPWSKGGRTTAENCQMLCQACNRRKGDV